MKRLIGLSALALAATPATAQWVAYPEVLQVDGEGEGAWLISCQLLDKKDRPVTRELKGRGKRKGHFGIFDVRGGQCSYQAAPDKPLLIAVNGGLYRCPLPSPVEGKCEQTFPAGATGQFDIRRRDLGQ